jgi:hypothetical protein
MQKLTGISAGQKLAQARITKALIVLLFSTQFTRISKTATLLEFPFCTEAPGNIYSFAM